MNSSKHQAAAARWAQRRGLLLAGVAGSVLLAALALAVDELRFLAWFALLPAVSSALVIWLGQRHHAVPPPMPLAHPVAPPEGATPPQSGAEVEQPSYANGAAPIPASLSAELTFALTEPLDYAALVARVLEALTTGALGFDRALLLVVDEAQNALVYGDVTHPPPSPERQFRLENLHLPLNPENPDPLLAAWARGELTVVQQGHERYTGSQLGWALDALEMETFIAAPLLLGGRLTGVILVDNYFTGRPFGAETRRLLADLSATVALALENARLRERTDSALSTRVAALRIQQQIDRELNASLRLDRVLTLTIDWALRFTNAVAGSVALYDPGDDVLRFVYGYGYGEAFEERRAVPIAPEYAGVTGRVVRTGSLQLVEDVSQDPDYVGMVPDIVAQLAVPVVLEHRVVAVLTLESSRPDTFNAEQIEFAERLADRAAVAIENTRLFDEMQREREKLSTILASTTDGVIVVGMDGRLELVNVTARSTFRLAPTADYRGMLLVDVFGGTPIVDLYVRAAERGRSVIDEIQLPDEHTYYVTVSRVQDVGWVVVMQDITHFRETDRLKSELVTTVSHDIKNPLNVLAGYVELIEMRNAGDEKLTHYLNMIRRSIVQMRQLVDDLLDMARIESGIELEMTPVEVLPALTEAVDAMQNLAAQRETRISIDVPDGLPPIRADRARLRQILHNLTSNAIKYTPAGGEVRLTAEVQGDFVLISVMDNGMGIAPEDQSKVFSRFYRVRRPETESIDGTGLGLAIVKSLVEMHGGEVGLESRLGEGSNFHFTVPRADTLPASQEAPSGAA